MTVLASDSGAGSDANPIGGNWTTITGLGAMRRLSNTIRGAASATDCGARNTAATWPSDQYSTAAIGAYVAGEDAGVVMRAASAATTLYAFVYGDTGNNAIALYRVVAGTWTQIANTTRTHTAGDVYEGRCIGTTISGRVNGAQQLSVTDANIASGSAGVVAYANTMQLTNWKGGDFASGATSPPLKRAFPQSILLR